MTLKTPSSKAFIDEGTLPLGCSSASFWPLSSDVFSTLNEGYASFLSGLVDISIQADSQCVSGLARRSSHQQPLDDLCGCKEDDHVFSWGGVSLKRIRYEPRSAPITAVIAMTTKKVSFRPPSETRPRNPATPPTPVARPTVAAFRRMNQKEDDAVFHLLPKISSA